MVSGYRAVANPEHKAVLDRFDKLSVCLYRSGISVFSIAAIFYAAILAGKAEWVVFPANMERMCLLIMALSSAMSAANVHVYDKYVRAVISWSSWVGILLMLSDTALSYVWLSLGFIFITFSGIALKESFCFKVFGLKLVPLLLAMSTFLMMFESWMLAACMLLLSGFVLAYLSLEKWRMPLHFDIGDKSNYQV